MKGSSYSLRVMKNAKQFNRPPAAAAHLTSLMPPTLPHTNQLQPVESISSTCPTRADISQEGGVSEQEAEAQYRRQQSLNRQQHQLRTSVKITQNVRGNEYSQEARASAANNAAIYLGLNVVRPIESRSRRSSLAKPALAWTQGSSRPSSSSRAVPDPHHHHHHSHRTGQLLTFPASPSSTAGDNVWPADPKAATSSSGLAKRREKLASYPGNGGGIAGKPEVEEETITELEVAGGDGLFGYISPSSGKENNGGSDSSTPINAPQDYYDFTQNQLKPPCTRSPSLVSGRSGISCSESFHKRRSAIRSGRLPPGRPVGPAAAIAAVGSSLAAAAVLPDPEGHYDDGGHNKQGGPPPHPYVPRSASGRLLTGPGGKPPTSRGHVKHTKGKGKKGKKGKKDQYDLIVNIDLDEWQLTDEQVAEFKEVFMLFDKDEDGVLTFPELNVVMKSLGQRPSEKDLLKMVRDVSEDQIYDTIEFNEFLQMMSKQQRFGLTEDSLKEAFRIFDKDDDGFISVAELRHIMQSLGEKMSDQEMDEMVTEADRERDGLINYEQFVQVLCSNTKKPGGKKKKKDRSKKQENKENLKNNNQLKPSPSAAQSNGGASAGAAEDVADGDKGENVTSNGNAKHSDSASSSSKATKNKYDKKRYNNANGQQVVQAKTASEAVKDAIEAAVVIEATTIKEPKIQGRK